MLFLTDFRSEIGFSRYAFAQRYKLAHMFACLHRTLTGKNEGSVKADNGAES